MFQFITHVSDRYQGYMTNLGRNRAREVLLQQSDKALEDIGISRGLLEAGVQYWPWTTTAVEQPLPKRAERVVKRRAEKQAIRELSAMTNAELHDIGISRGDIADVVRYGRPGIEHNRYPTAMTHDVSQLLKNPRNDVPVDELGIGSAANRKDPAVA